MDYAFAAIAGHRRRRIAPAHHMAATPSSFSVRDGDALCSNEHGIDNFLIADRTKVWARA